MRTEKIILTVSLLVLAASLAACGQPGEEAEAPATVADADAFVEELETEGYQLYLDQTHSQWMQETHTSVDTQYLASQATAEGLLFGNRMVEESKRFNDLDLNGDTARIIALLKLGSSMPAPSDEALVLELAELSSDLSGMYGSESQLLNELSGVIADLDASPDAKREAWEQWRQVSIPMRDKYLRFIELMNIGATELGFADTGDLWRSAYDMTAEEFDIEARRLWEQVSPLYEALHCYVRDGLADHYGDDVVSRDGPIPAYLLGNMWAQSWSGIYDLVRPYESELNLDVTGELERRRDAERDSIVNELGGFTGVSAQELVDAERQADILIAEDMTRFAEGFYTSMGLSALPDTFYERSMMVQPRDRLATCHASAWPIDPETSDVRIKMCIEPNEEELITIYHELGHIYYFMYYFEQPLSFQGGAHDGFHEAIGDAITLSMTPEYLQSVGLISNYEPDEEALINNQMKLALDKIAFLPFGKMIDEWRWRAFSGEIPADALNEGWWNLRTEYQGIAAPTDRGEEFFDPGAKYHVPGNTPYTRYFLAYILQFQFHQAMCEAADFEGPLHECSVFGSEAAGDRLAAMLEMGSSRPWPEALEAMTGSPEMDASAIIDYFDPLMTWLENDNAAAGRTCGW
jgi:peptidyl-dipeptidase A